MDLVIFMKKQQEELGKLHQREEHTGSQRSSSKGARIPSSRSVDSIVPRDVAASLERMDLNNNNNLNGNSNNNSNGYTFNSGSNNSGYSNGALGNSNGNISGNGRQKVRRRSNDRGATNLPPTAAFSEELTQQVQPYALHPPSPQFTSPRNLSPQSHSPNQQMPNIPFGSAMTNGYPPYHPQQFYGQPQQQQQQQHFTFQGYDQDQGTSFQQNYHVPYAIQTQGMSQDNSGQSSPLSHSELYMSQDSSETLSLQEQLELQDELDPLDSFEENYHTRRRASTFDKQHTENQYPPPPRGKLSNSVSDPEGLARYDREASHLIERRNSASSQKSRSRSRSPMPTPPLPQKAQRFPSSRRRLSLSANAPLPVIHQQSLASLQTHRRASLPDLHPYGGTGIRKSGSHSDGFNELTSMSSPSLSTVPVIEEAEDEQLQSEGYYGVQHREVYQADFIKEILDFPPPDTDFPSHPSYDQGLYEGENQLQLGLAPLTPMSMGNLSTPRFSELMYHTEAYGNGL